MNKTECEVYHLKTDCGNWLAQIVLTSDGAMMVVSDWGNFNICWRAYNNLEKLKQFLSNINLGYLADNAARSNNYVYGNTKKGDAAANRFAMNVFNPFQKILIKELESEVTND